MLSRVVVFLFIAVLAVTVQAGPPFVVFEASHISRSWLSDGAPANQFIALTQAACEADTRKISGVGYLYGDGVPGINCYAFTSYPTLCSGSVNITGQIIVQGVLNRCGGGYKVGPDATCIYTGGNSLTDALYAESCSGGAPVLQRRLHSPFKRNKRIQSPFLGGRVCPKGEQACGIVKNWKCLNVQQNLNSCGGCIGGSGVDCSTIVEADEVQCLDGACVICSCIKSWTLSSSGQCEKDCVMD